MWDQKSEKEIAMTMKRSNEAISFIGKVLTTFELLEWTIRNVIDSCIQQRETRREGGKPEKWWEGQIDRGLYSKWVNQWRREGEQGRAISKAYARDLYKILHRHVNEIEQELFPRIEDHGNLHGIVKDFKDVITIRNIATHNPNRLTMRDVNIFFYLCNKSLNVIPHKYHYKDDNYDKTLSHLLGFCQDLRYQEKYDDNSLANFLYKLYQKFSVTSGQNLFWLLIAIGSLGIAILIIINENSQGESEFFTKKSDNAEVLLRAEKSQTAELDEQMKRASKPDQQPQLRQESQQADAKSAALSSPGTISSHSIKTRLKLISEPEGADIFLDWEHQGKTPMMLKSKGFLVLAKDGYEAWFQHIDTQKNKEIRASLSIKVEPSQRKLILIVSDYSPDESLSALRSGLREHGFMVLNSSVTDEFQKVGKEAGSLSHPGFRAWAWTKFGAEYYAKVRVDKQKRHNNSQFSQLDGVIRATSTIQLDLYSLKSGRLVAQVDSIKSDFSLSSSQAFEKALSLASSDMAVKLHKYFQDYKRPH